MNIITGNIEEYIIVKLCLVGEIDQEELFEDSPFSKGSVYRAIKNLKSQRVILKHRYDDGRTFLRLSSLSAEYIGNLSPALLANARQLVREDMKYSGSKQVRLRDRDNYEFYEACLDMGIPLNDFTYAYRKKKLFEQEAALITEGTAPYREDGTPLTFEEIARRIDGSYTGLYTKKLIKQRENGTITNQGNRNTRITGTLFINGQMYETYALADPCMSSWVAEAEFGASNYVAGCIQRESPYYRDKGIFVDNRCILAFPSVEMASKMISPPEGKTLRIDPCRIYSASYVIPSYKLTKSMMKLLGKPDWRRYMAVLAFDDGKRVGIADIVRPDGTEVYNFIGCDISWIRHVAPRIQQADAKMSLLVEEWMSEPMHEIFGRDNVEIVEMSDQDIEVFADYIL